MSVKVIENSNNNHKILVQSIEYCLETKTLKRTGTEE